MSCLYSLPRSRSRRAIPVSYSRPALTLLELVAVLVILAIVATVAVNSLQPRVEQVRWEQARHLLEEIRQACVGSSRAFHADGTPLVSGFVADVGRLPRSSPLRDGTSPDTSTLLELWDRQGKLALEFPYRFRGGPSQPVDYSSVRLPCGWRGPYLTLGVGQESIVDPWGRPFDCWVDASGAVTGVRTRPLPGSVEIQTLEVDLTVGLVTVSGVLSWREQAPPTELAVVLLTPDPQQSIEVLAVRADEDPEVSSFLFSNVPVGLRAICIQANDRLIVRYVTVPPGGVALNLSIGGTEP